jgi:hypothetical protein
LGQPIPQRAALLEHASARVRYNCTTDVERGPSLIKETGEVLHLSERADADRLQRCAIPTDDVPARDSGECQEQPADVEGHAAAVIEGCKCVDVAWRCRRRQLVGSADKRPLLAVPFVHPDKIVTIAEHLAGHVDGRSIAEICDQH